MKTKFYALMTGNKSVEKQASTTMLDSKAKKDVDKTETKFSKKPKSVLVVLETSRSRAEAQQLATDYANKNGLKLQSIHTFK